MRKDRGQAGMQILLSVIVMLFMIGLIVMIFTVMGNKLATTQYVASSGTVVNDSFVVGHATTFTLSQSTLRDVVCTVTSVHNDSVLLGSGNYSVSSCVLSNLTSDGFTTGYIHVNYTYTYSADNTATNVINDTTGAIGGVTDWFSIFITITAMVVLILLVVIIILSIRSSGLVDAGGMKRGSVEGTA